MRFCKYVLLTIAFMFLTKGNIAAQSHSEIDSIREYDKKFAEGLRKHWKPISFTKKNHYSNTRSQTKEKEADLTEQSLSQNDLELIREYDRQFAEKLRSGDWQKIDFVIREPFKERNEPENQPFILERTVDAPSLASRTYTFTDRSYRLRLDKSYKDDFKTSIDNVRYYGWEFSIFYDDAIHKYELGIPSELGDFWERLSNSKWSPFIEQTKKYAGKLGIETNDWAYVLLIHKIGRTIFFKDEKANNVFTCFMLNHSGVTCRMFRDNDKDMNIYLLFSTEDAILGAPYNSDSESYYYDLYKNPDNRLEKKNAITPEIDYSPPGFKTKKIAPFARVIPKLPDNSAINDSKVFSFLVSTPRARHSIFPSMGYMQKQERTVEATVNPNRIEYYDDIPPTTLEAYFKASRFITYNEDLMNGLTNLLYNRDTYKEQVNLLLDFTSSESAFRYKADSIASFPDQTLDDRPSDCEDRSVLFAGLAQHLLGVKVLGIECDDHVFVAIPHRFDPIFGDETLIETIEHNGEIYALCDPTADNASYGMLTNKYKKLMYEKDYGVIDFKSYITK